MSRLIPVKQFKIVVEYTSLVSIDLVTIFKDSVLYLNNNFNKLG